MTASSRRTTGRLRWWLPRLTLAVVGGVLLGVALDVGQAGGLPRWLTRHGDPPPYEAHGTRVALAGRHLYVDCRGSGSPTVVLEAGMGSDSATWSPLIDELAALTRTCAYDRIGRGRSDPGKTGDLATISDTLADLLTAAGERGPYIAVGHSFGAVVARVHASRHREEIAGLVLVDGFDPDVFDERVFPLLGAHSGRYLGYTDRLWELVGSTEQLDVGRSKAELAAADVAGLSIEVVRAARYEAGLDEEANRRIDAASAAGYEAMSPGRVRLTSARGAGHVVQFDRPDLVVDAVRRLVEAARAARPGWLWRPARPSSPRHQDLTKCQMLETICRTAYLEAPRRSGPAIPSAGVAGRPPGALRLPLAAGAPTGGAGRAETMTQTAGPAGRGRGPAAGDGMPGSPGSRRSRGSQRPRRTRSW